MASAKWVEGRGQHLAGQASSPAGENRLPPKTLQCDSGASGGEGYGLSAAPRECQGQTVDGVAATVAGIRPNYYQSKNSAARAPTSSSPAFQLSTTTGTSSRRTLPPWSRPGWRWSPCWARNQRSRWWSALLWSVGQGLVELVRALQGGSVAAWQEPNQCHQPPRPPSASVSLQPGEGEARHRYQRDMAGHSLANGPHDNQVKPASQR